MLRLAYKRYTKRRIEHTFLWNPRVGKLGVCIRFGHCQLSNVTRAELRRGRDLHSGEAREEKKTAHRLVRNTPQPTTVRSRPTWLVPELAGRQGILGRNMPFFRNATASTWLFWTNEDGSAQPRHAGSRRCRLDQGCGGVTCFHRAIKPRYCYYIVSQRLPQRASTRLVYGKCSVVHLDF